MTRAILAFVVALLFGCATPTTACADDEGPVDAPVPAARSHSATSDSVANAKPRERMLHTPRPLARCDYFLVLEVADGLMTGDSPKHSQQVQGGSWLDRNLLRNSLGVMKNVSPSRSVGATADGYWGGDRVFAGSSVRLRHWFDRRSSVECGIGYMWNKRPGPSGYIGSVRYAPIPELYVETGVCQEYVEWVRWDGRSPTVAWGMKREPRVFGGLGATAGGAGGLMVVEGVALGALVVMMLTMVPFM